MTPMEISVKAWEDTSMVLTMVIDMAGDMENIMAAITGGMQNRGKEESR